jgi:hypothetical protein
MYWQKKITGLLTTDAMKENIAERLYCTFRTALHDRLPVWSA